MTINLTSCTSVFSDGIGDYILYSKLSFLDSWQKKLLYESIIQTIYDNFEQNYSLSNAFAGPSSSALEIQRSRIQNPVRPFTFISQSADLRRAVVNYW